MQLCVQYMCAFEPRNTWDGSTTYGVWGFGAGAPAGKYIKSWRSTFEPSGFTCHRRHHVMETRHLSFLVLVAQ